jgi:predicted nuclease of predicted toxin-antitoxin system
MKVLIDENLPRKLAGHLKGHECRTVTECGWAGKTNGELLSLAEPLFDVLLTLDKNIPYQQDLQSGRIAILIVRARSNRIQDLLPVIPDCLATLECVRPGQVVRVGNVPTR